MIGLNGLTNIFGEFKWNVQELLNLEKIPVSESVKARNPFLVLIGVDILIDSINRKRL